MDTMIGSVDICKSTSNDFGSPPKGAFVTIQNFVSPTVINSSEATLDCHLARRLVQIGITDVFSVPGDFNLTLVDHLIVEPGLNLIRCCNELNAGYAADGFAQSRGIGACVVTFTVSGLSALNAIAGAYSENLPLICIVGGPNSNDYGTNRILHHTIGLPDFSQELRCFQTVTCYQVGLGKDFNAKLLVDCSGEGVMFIEADADVTLEQFGDALQPPFPCLEELLYDVPGSGGVLNCPLLLIQVTRLRCGGFIFALRLNHTISDADGLTQFMLAVGEMARGWLAPSIPPVWERHLLGARDPPRITYKHREYDEVEGTIVPYDDMAHRSFFFGPTEVSALRKLVPQHLHKCSTFELLTACLWRCRTIAIQANPEEEVRIICIVNARSKFNPPLPSGYYGNAFAFPVVVAEAGKLCQNPLGYALELVKQAKADVTEEYMKSLADLMVIKGRPHFTVVRSYLVSDVTRAGFGDVDFGWGKAVYGGPAKGGVGAIPFKNKKGEVGIVLPITLPAPAMEIFVKELDGMLKEKLLIDEGENKSVFISSSL